MTRAISVAAAVAIGLGGAGPAPDAVAAQAASAAPSPAHADADPLAIPCDGLPPSAVRVVPPPLDHYVTLVCTRSGQALRPVSGYSWVFDQGAIWLSATNPQAPSKGDSYTGLSYKPMSPDALAALRAELGKLRPDPSVLTRSILRFAVTTSWGEHKEIYLLPPPSGAGADARTVGMECIHACRPIDKDPWFFAIVPDGPGAGK